MQYSLRGRALVLGLLGSVLGTGIAQAQATERDANLVQVVRDFHTLGDGVGRYGPERVCSGLRAYIFLNFDVVATGLAEWKRLTDAEKQALYERHEDVLHPAPSSSGFHDIADNAIRWAAQGRCAAISRDDLVQTARALAYGSYVANTAAHTLFQPAAALVPRELRRRYEVGQARTDGKVLVTISVSGGLTKENELAYTVVEQTLPADWVLERAAAQALPLPGAEPDPYTQNFLLYVYVPRDVLDDFQARLRAAGFTTQ